MITITDPNSGLPQLMKMLEMYGVHSGYKFNWHSSHTKYLGVILPEDLSQLFDINYNCRNKKNNDDLWGWGLLPLDYGSRIRSFKMNTYPRLLYLFLSLPVEIPQKQLKEWNKHISRFIWDKKRPRVKFSTLRRPEGEGGMALTSLEDYYLPEQLRPLVYWWNLFKWETMEISLTDTPTQSLIGCVDLF